MGFCWQVRCLNNMETKCLCGCGKETNIGKKYLIGHHMNGRKRDDETKRRISIKLKGRKLSKEHISKLKGKPSHKKGKKVPIEYVLKSSRTLKRLYAEGKLKPWNKGLIGVMPDPYNKGKRKYKDIDLWKDMYLKEKKSTCQIGKELEIDSAMIYKRLIEEGVKLRTKKEASKINEKSKLTRFKKGQVPHNKGKIKENYEPIRRRSKKRERKDINEKKDYIIKLYTDDNNSQMQIANILGCDFVIINRILKENGIKIRPQSFYMIGKEDKKKGKTLEEYYGKEKAKEISKKIRIARSKQIFPLKDTSIELKIQDFLTALKIEFITHKYMNIKNAYQCDIFIPEQEGINKKTVIECDGDFFHMNPNKFSAEDKIFKKGITAKEKWELDESRTKQLIEKGYKVLRMWESEIKEITLKDFENKLNYQTITT